MSEAVEFGEKAAADRYREEYPNLICPEDDDKRQKTVHFISDTPDHVLRQARAEAAEGRAAREATVGQADLTDAERDRIDFSRGNASVPWARSIKALAQQHNVSDWTAYADPTLTVDEHREVMERAGREGGGARDSGDQRDAERERRAAATEQAEGCDHARGHCENGDPDACEFLSDVCGYDEDEVQSLLSDHEDEGLTGEQKGALSRSWSGYKGAVTAFGEAIEQARVSWELAQEAARAINGIRADVDQEPLHFDALEAGQAELLDFTRKAAADCHECHADHSEHEHAVDSGHWENVTRAVRQGARETPVGVGDTDHPLRGSRPMREPTGSTPDHPAEGYPDAPKHVHLRGTGITPDEMEGSIEAPGGRRRAVDRENPEQRQEVKTRMAQVAARDEEREAEREVLEHDDQRDLSGGRADDQALLAGGERGEHAAETVETVEENPGGLEADRRDTTSESDDTEQSVPDAFNVAEGGQNTLTDT